MKYEIEYSCICDIGKCREINQDNFVCNKIYQDDELEKLIYPIRGNISSDKGDIIGVFDGLGGEQCGEIASLLASKYASTIQISNKPIDDLLTFCKNANERICTYADEHGISSMGTTAAILEFSKKGVFLCNIGDSKIFRFSNGRLKQISEDHISIAAYGRKPPLSQNLGIPPSELVIDPYIAQGKYLSKDIYLICSDGLTDMISNERIQEVLNTIPFEEVTPILLKEALEKGGKDNITIIVCKIKSKSLFQKIKGYLSTKRK